jgi:polyhydroxyalkanoate synthesis regulator phasin
MSHCDPATFDAQLGEVRNLEKRIKELENDLACERSANASHWEVNKQQAVRIKELELREKGYLSELADYAKDVEALREKLKLLQDKQP